jgi:hypothetical protein
MPSGVVEELWLGGLWLETGALKAHGMWQVRSEHVKSLRSLHNM